MLRFIGHAECVCQNVCSGKNKHRSKHKIYIDQNARICLDSVLFVSVTFDQNRDFLALLTLSPLELIKEWWTQQTTGNNRKSFDEDWKTI